MRNSTITPSTNYPDKLNDKELKAELDKFVVALKNHDPENGLIDTLNYYAAMVNTGYLEVQKRETSKGAKWSITLGVITTIAAFVSIWISIHATKLSQESSSSSDINQNNMYKLENKQTEILNKINEEVAKIKINTDTLTKKNIKNK